MVATTSGDACEGVVRVVSAGFAGLTATNRINSFIEIPFP
jgi:hypothetical protein